MSLYFLKGVEMGIVLEILVWFFIEILFWGLMFYTGRLILSMLSNRKWEIQSNDIDPKQYRKEPKFIGTALIGFLFWVGFWIILVISVLKT